MITGAELLEALPVIVSLILIEGLLSVDNALAIAAMASHLPKEQQTLALRLGIFGAYAFRGLAILLASAIIANPWIKLIGALYLIYLLGAHIASHKEEPGDETGAAPVGRSFWSTVFAIEVMDLSLSVDNVVAAVAMSNKLWVVCTGVFIGILALRFVAGACIRLIERFPILNDTAFLLIGYVGAILCVEVASDPASGLRLFPEPVHVHSLQKFVGIVLITALSLAYGSLPTFRWLVSPLVRAGSLPLRYLAIAIQHTAGLLASPFTWAWNRARAR